MNALGDVAIMGGGCYGTFYLQHLTAARARGSIAFRRLLIVDQHQACQASAHHSHKLPCISYSPKALGGNWSAGVVTCR